MIRLLLLPVAVTALAGCGASTPPRLPSAATSGEEGPKAVDPFRVQRQPEFVTSRSQAPAAVRQTKQDLLARATGPATLVGLCGGIDAPLGSLFIALSDGPGVWVRLDDAWPAAVQGAHEQCRECRWGAEVTGQLIETGGELSFVAPTVTRFWRESE